MRHDFLAQTVTKSFLQRKAAFCVLKKATNGSSFFKLQKGLETKKLVVNGWISY
jgi:hypothetical protein